VNSKIFQKINSLPPLPKSVLEVQRITNDPNSSIKDLVKIIKEDPMLTANLLKVANSPLYGFAREIKSVDQAVSLFGMTPIKGFVISFAVRNSIKFDLSTYGITENFFHDISIKRNALAFNWYKGNKKIDSIATDAFLLDLGAVIISLVLVSENKADEFKNKLTKENRDELEKEYVGTTTLEITYEIFKHWHFSDELIKPLKNLISNEKNNEYLEESYALDVIRTMFNMLGEDEEDYKKAIEKAKKYNLNVEKLNKAFKVIQESN